MLGDLQSQPPSQKWGCWVNLLHGLFLSLVMIVVLPILEPKTQSSETAIAQSLIPINGNSSSLLLTFQGNTLRSISEPIFSKKPIAIIKNVIVTGYSSTIWETDDTPFITASGTWVHEGIVATNLLPFGAKIRIPEIYGDKVFEVEDRMHSRNSYNVDIWFENHWQANNFGVARAKIEVLEK